LLEKGVERAAALAVVALNVNELLVECLQIGVGESWRVENDFVAEIDRPGVVDGRGFQGKFVLAEGAAVIAHHDLRLPRFGVLDPRPVRSAVAGRQIGPGARKEMIMNIDDWHVHCLPG